MRRLLLVLLGISIVPACRSDRDLEYDRDYRRAPKTPSGFHVEFMERGTIGTGLMTLREIHAIFDREFLKAADILEAKSGLPIQVFLATPHEERLIFVLVDRYQYPSAWNGWVRGEYADNRVIYLCFWNQRLYTSPGPSDPVWTIEPRNGTGPLMIGHRPGEISDLIAHEMGHVFFGPAYGH